MDKLTFIPPLVGGILIGLSVAILILTNGKIAGISGILGALMQIKNTPKNHYSWRILFLFGLLASSYVYSFFAPLPVPEIVASKSSLIIAGLLVGFGTRMGSGCTSGHGICGLSRLSVRSFAATMSFMISGALICYLLLH